MADITEYGDVMLNTVIDEWGRRRINGLLEDGTRILIAAAAPIIKTWTGLLNTSHVYARPTHFFKLTQTLNTFHTFIHHRFMRLTQVLWALHAWIIEYPALILKQWFAALEIAHTLRRPQRLIQITETFQTAHAFSRPCLLYTSDAADE